MSTLKTLSTIWKLTTWTVFLGILIVAGLFAAGHFGLISFPKPYVVLSGSMEPTIHTGSIVLVISKPYGYAPGDIITFKHGTEKTATTHRIKSLEMQNGAIVYQTKGDANNSTDPGLVSPDQVVGSMILTIPYLGRLANYASKPQGFVAFVIIPATIIIYEELKNIKRELAKTLASLFHKPPASSDPPKSQSTKFTLTSSSSGKPNTNFLKAGFLLVPLVAGLLVGYPASLAVYHDTAKSINNFFQASSTFAGDPEPTPTTSPSPTPEITPSPTATPSGIILPSECSALQGIITKVIEGTSGNDRLFGTSASELIIGHGGNDHIFGGSGSDCIVAGSGNDIIYAGAGNDIIIGGGGNDQINGDDGDDTIYAGDGNDQLRGYAGNDTIYASAGNDNLTGDAGDDHLDGGEGTDVLNGSSGTDTCIAGETFISCEL